MLTLKIFTWSSFSVVNHFLFFLSSPIHQSILAKVTNDFLIIEFSGLFFFLVEIFFFCVSAIPLLFFFLFVTFLLYFFSPTFILNDSPENSISYPYSLLPLYILNRQSYIYIWLQLSFMLVRFQSQVQPSFLTSKQTYLVVYWISVLGVPHWNQKMILV